MPLDDTNTLAQEVETPSPDETVETNTNEDEGPVSLDPVDEPETAEEANPDEGEAESSEEEGTTDPEVEFAEIEINGTTYQVPAELKDGYMQQADYTQKTQAIGESKRQLEAERAALEQSRQLSDEEMNARVSLASINQRIEQYENVDWNAWQDTDPVSAQKAWIEFQQLERSKTQYDTQISESQARRSEMAQQETAKRLHQTLEFAQKNIKGWSKEVDAKVTQFAVETLGFTQDTLKGAYNPQVYQTLYLAMLGHKSLSNQSAAKSVPGGRQKQIKPLKTVSAKNSGKVHKDPAEMSMAEYDKWAADKYKD